MSSDYEQRMRAAIAAVKNGQSQKAATELYGVHQSTLSRRLTGRVSRDEAHKMDRLFSPEHERAIANWAHEEKSAGKTLQRQDIVDFAQCVLREQGRGALGRHWIERFLDRHPDLKQKPRNKPDTAEEPPEPDDQDGDQPSPQSDDQNGDQPTSDIPKRSQDLLRQFKDLEAQSDESLSDAKFIVQEAGKAIDLLTVQVAALKRENEALKAEIERSQFPRSQAERLQTSSRKRARRDS